MTDQSKLDFFKSFRPAGSDSRPKYARLRDALVAAIESGYWNIGEQLPTEAELTRLTPYSLGTVQRAVQALVSDGLVTRRQGRGTFVAGIRKRLDQPWHFRFLDDDETGFLPVFAKILARKRMAKRGPWSRYLDQAGNNILRIDRTVNVNDEFTAYNIFYLNADRFSVIASMPLKEIDGANLKAVLRKTYNLPITHVSQKVSIKAFPEDICRLIHAHHGTQGLFVEIVASAGKSNYLYYQELFVPPTQRKLYISEFGPQAEPDAPA